MREILESLLGVDKNNPFFEVLFNPLSPNNLQIHYGMRLLEIVPRNSFPEKLLIARLFNGGHNQKSLKSTFKYDIKTMRCWGRLLKLGDTASIKKIGIGAGAMKKLTEDKQRYINYLFEEHYGSKGCHINKFISEEYFKCYKEKITVEALRLLLKGKKDKIDNPNLKSDIEVEENEPSDGLFLEEEINKLLENPTNTTSDLNLEKHVDFSSKGENSLNNNSNLALKNEEKSNDIPYQESFNDDNFPIVDSRFKQIFSCHHIGILLSRIFLDLVSEPLDDIRNITRQGSLFFQKLTIIITIST